MAKKSSWASNFGEVVSSLELAPEGTGYRFRNRSLVTTNVTANIYEQTIVGNCTTHSRPEGKLPKGQIAYVNTGSGFKIYKDGYNTTMWGTGELGRQMFWRVWGTEYTPTSWTGL